MKHTNVWSKVLLLALCLVLGLSCLFSCNGEEIEALNGATAENKQAIEDLKAVVDQVKGTADAAATAAALEAVKTELASVKTTADAAATAAKLDEVESVLKALIDQNDAADAATKTELENAIAAVKATADAAATKAALDEVKGDLGDLEDEYKAAIAALETKLTAAINGVNTALETAKTELNNRIAAAEKAFADFKKEYEDLDIADRLDTLEDTVADIKTNLDNLAASDALAEYKAATELLKGEDPVYSYKAFQASVWAIDEDKYPKDYFKLFMQEVEKTEFFLSRATTVAEVKGLIDGFNTYVENKLPTLAEVYLVSLSTVVITNDPASIANLQECYDYLDDKDIAKIIPAEVEVNEETINLEFAEGLTIAAAHTIALEAHQNAIDAAAAVGVDVIDVIATIDAQIIYLDSNPEIINSDNAIKTFVNTYFANAQYNEFYKARNLENKTGLVIAADYITNYETFTTAQARHNALDAACEAYLAYDFNEAVDTYATVRPLWTQYDAVKADYDWYTAWVAFNNEDAADDIEEVNIIAICNAANGKLATVLTNAQAALVAAQAALDAANTDLATKAAAAETAANELAAATAAAEAAQALVAAKDAEIAAKQDAINEATAAGDTALISSLSAELATLQTERETLNNDAVAKATAQQAAQFAAKDAADAKAAAEAVVTEKNAAVVTATNAVADAQYNVNAKPAITASTDLLVVKAYNFVSAMKTIFEEQAVVELNAATDAYIAKNVKDEALYVYYEFYDDVYGDDGLVERYNALETAINAVPDATTATNNNYIEMKNYESATRSATLDSICGILTAYETIKNDIKYLLTTGVVDPAVSVGMMDLLDNVNYNDYSSKIMVYDDVLEALYVKCTAQNIVPAVYKNNIVINENSVDYKDKYTYTVEPVTEGDANYVAIVAKLQAELTATAAADVDPEYILACLDGEYIAMTQGVADIYVEVRDALEVFAAGKMSLFDGWAFVADPVKDENGKITDWTVGEETGLAYKLGYVCYTLGVPNIELVIEGETEKVNLNDLNTKYTAAILEYKTVANNAQAAAAILNQKIENTVADALANADDLNNRAAILALWSEYMTWAQTYLKNDTDVTDLDSHAAAIAALYDEDGNGIPSYGDAFNFEFITVANHKTLYDAYNLTNATFELAKADWAVLKAKLEALDEAGEWDIHSYGDIDGVPGIDENAPAVNFVAVNGEFLKYVKTYYKADDSALDQANVVALEIGEAKTEYEVYEAFWIQMDNCAIKVGQYQADAETITDKITALVAETYETEAIRKSLIEGADLATLATRVAEVKTLINQFYTDYCTDNCMFITKDANYLLMLAKVDNIVKAATATVAQSAHADYADIVEEYYVFATTLPGLKSVEQAEAAYNNYAARINDIVTPVAP